MNESVDEFATCARALAGELGPFETMLTLNCPTGEIVAADPLVNPDRSAMLETVAPGKYPVLGLADPDDGRLAIVVLQIADRPVVTWEFATSYGVDTGLGCYMDVAASEALVAKMAELEQDRNFSSYYDDVLDEELYDKAGDENAILFTDHLIDADKSLNIAIFESGWGDGVYDVFVGRDDSGEIVCFATDFQLLGP